MKFKNYIETESGIKDTSTSPGTAGQVLSSTVAGTSWIDQGEIIAAAATLVTIECKNIHTAPLLKGTPVYQTGTVGATDVIEIAPGSALVSDGAQPSIGLLQQDLAINEFGYVVITGGLLNITTDPIDGLTPVTGQKVFVKSGGGLTLTKPTTELNSIQNMGLVGKVSGGNAGSITVSSIMRTNDVPNLPEGRIWIGDGNTIVSDTVYVDEPNGRMGIGTTLPAEKLDVSGRVLANAFRTDTSTSDYSVISRSQPNNPPLYVQSADSNNNQPIAKFFYGNTAPGQGTIVLNVAKDRTYFSNTNVGIGTTSPGVNFQVGDGTTDTSSRFYHGDNTYTQVSGYGLYFSRLGSYIRPVFDGTQDLYFGSITNTWKSIQFDATTITFDNNSSEAMRITSSGNVGIGTTSPQATLHISKGSNDSPTVMRIENVDTTIATGQEVNTIQFYSNDASASGTGISSKISQVAVNPGNQYALAFSTYNLSLNEAMRIDANGNVGIGTTNPLQRLHLNGGTDVNLQIGAVGTELQIKTTNDADSAYIPMVLRASEYNILSGNVGIGTTSPTANLHVQGSSATDVPIIRSGGFGNSGSKLELAETLAAGGDMIYGFSFFNDGNVSNTLQIRSHNNSTTGVTAMSIGRTDALTTFSTVPIVGTRTAGDNTTYAASTAFVTNAVAGVPIGNYLPLSAGASYPLTGKLYAQDDIYISGEHVVKNIDTNLYLDSASGYNVLLRPGGSEKVRIQANGNVGIGTTSPAKTLNVEFNSSSVDPETGEGLSGGYSGTGVLLKNRNTTVGTFANLDFRANNVDARIALTYNATNNGDFNFILDNTAVTPVTRLIIKGETGNVGIGTTSPSEKLDVNGNAIVRGNTIVKGNIVSRDTYPSVYVDHSGTVMGGIRADGTNKLELKTLTTAPLSFQVNSSEKMRILSSGNVGIGTTSPEKKLHVSSNDQSAARIRLSNTNTASGGDNIELVAGVHNFAQDGFSIYNATSNQTQLVIQGGGNVGIGTTSPSRRIDVRTGVFNSPVAQFTGANDGRGLLISTFQRASNDDSVDYDTPFGGHHTFSASGLERVRITDTGNVGIGTTNPGTFLQLGAYAIAGKYINQATYPDVPSEHMMHITAPSTSAYYGGGISFGERYFTAANIVVRDAGGSGALDLCFGTGTNAGVTEKMRVASNGNVGIGTTSPVTTLDVQGSIFTRGGLYFTPDGSTSSIPAWGMVLNGAGDLVIDDTVGPKNVIFSNAGNVGIGTTSPATKLSVNGGVQVAHEPDTASAALVGTLRYRTSLNNSYVDMCMQTGATTYAWVNIVSNTW